jgi:hypothetical protein
MTELSEFLSSQKTIQSVPKHPVSNHLTIILTKLYNTADINNQHTSLNTNIVILKRVRKNNILISSSTNTENLGQDEIDRFYQMMDDKNINGIFISQNSGIVGKKDFQIEIINNNVLVFIHNADFSPVKVELATTVIDHLSQKIRQFGGKTEADCVIPKDILESINTEYQLFISQKNAVIEVFKESQRKVLTQIDEIRFPNLDRFLSTQFTTTVQKPGFKCDLCKSFSGNNLKALAAHKRGCIRKQTPVVVANTIST